MDPVDCTGFVFDSSAGLWVVLHDLPGANFAININLPKNHFLLSRGSQQVIVGCLNNLEIGEMIAEKPYEV